MDFAEHNYADSELAYKEFLKPSLLQGIELLQIQDDCKILDAGCGPGAMFLNFANKLGSIGHITGADASPIHLDVARQNILQNRLGNLVSLIKVDLFKELPFEDNSFDLIWLSDVLFPDDFGHEIRNTIDKLIPKLKPNGKIAIFYGNWLRLMLLSGYSQLEHNISIANERRKSINFEWLPEVHPENALGWLRKSGLVNCRNNYFTTYYQTPLEESIKSYIHYHLKNIYGQAIKYEDADFKIAESLIGVFYNITDPNSEEYILNNHDYHCAVHALLTTGQKMGLT